MASKNIAITENIYHELLKRKYHDESFTQVISRLLEEKDRSSNYFGQWKDLPSEDFKKIDAAKKELRKIWIDRNIS
jgi:predicted CopG family antitoxin